MNKGNKETVVVVGLWHLGCTVAACLARAGYKVTGLDFSKQLIDNLNKAKMPIEEAGLAELTKEQLSSGGLSFSNNFTLVKKAKYLVIAYDTPVNDQDKPNLNIIYKALTEIKFFLAPGSTIIVMSQVPVGTCRKFIEELNTPRTVKGLELVYNPENVRLGDSLKTYAEADRMVVGVNSLEARKRMEKFYKFFNHPVFYMSLESAEVVKHSINSFLASSVSFINQVADFSEAVGANIIDVVRGMQSDSRIGHKAFLSPGLGFAGGTLGRDLRVLEDTAKKAKVGLNLISEIYHINSGRKDILFKKVSRIYPDLKDKTVTVLGLVYKPGTSTLRRSLSVEIANKFLAEGAVVHAYDPSLSNGQVKIRGIKLFDNPYKASKGADLLVIITEWPEFKNLDYKKIGSLMATPIIFDTKNILNASSLINKGFTYFGTGIADRALAEPWKQDKAIPEDFSTVAPHLLKQWYKGKKVVITGGSGGIGKAIALKFAQAGATIILLARNKDKLQATQKQIQKFSKCFIYPLAIENIQEVEDTFKNIFKRFAQIDILVNCAGVYGPIGKMHTNNLEQWHEALNINLLGTVNAVHAVLPEMAKQRRGKIITLSGGGAVHPFPNFSSYATSKVAIVRFTENIAKEYEKNNIQINAISPGAVNTTFLSSALKAGRKAVGDEFYQKSLEQKQTGGQSPEIAAELVLFLCSPKAHNITGKLISAIWDPWKNFGKDDIVKLSHNSEYTLRRIDNRYFKEINP